MNKKLITLMVAALALLSARGQLAFTGVGEHPVIELTPEISTGLNKIYVVFDTEGVGMTFNSSTGEPATWESFDYRNGNLEMEPVPGVRWNGMATTLPQVIPNIGYKITEGTTPYFCWVVNYADHYLELFDIDFSYEDACDLISFSVDGFGDDIPYYDIIGHRHILDRELRLQYETLERDDTTDWRDLNAVAMFESLEQPLEIAPPLVETRFTLSGDRFLRQWGLDTAFKESQKYLPRAVRCGAVAVDDNGDFVEEVSEGSSPVHIVFTGYPTPAVVYRAWEISEDPDFVDADRHYQDVLDYNFVDAATYYVRYVVANDDGSCDDYSKVFTINVSESDLERYCPNVFSPSNHDGVNDVWKVKSKSLVEFHCWIFNRWGNLVYEFTDPDDGWDGTYRGKLVEPGVYYYVITAVGNDGKKFKRRGDITIVNYKRGVAGGSNGGSVR